MYMISQAKQAFFGSTYLLQRAERWKYHCLLSHKIAPKIEGGLGIIDIKEMADRLAWLLNRKNHLFHIQGFHKWTALPFYTIFASKFGIFAKGSELAVSLWKAWFRIKQRLKFSSHAKDLAGFHRIDSIWWPALELSRVQPQDLDDALKMHKMGI